jgi:hypothetical protein
LRRGITLIPYPFTGNWGCFRCKIFVERACGGGVGAEESPAGGINFFTGRPEKRRLGEFIYFENGQYGN